MADAVGQVHRLAGVDAAIDDDVADERRGAELGAGGAEDGLLDERWEGVDGLHPHQRQAQLGGSGAKEAEHEVRSMAVEVLRRAEVVVEALVELEPGDVVERLDRLPEDRVVDDVDLVAPAGQRVGVLPDGHDAA